MNMLISRVLVLIALSTITLTSLHAKTNRPQDYARSTADGQAAVATVHPLATKAGLDAIDAGGNAIDAALAAAFTLGVVDSHNSGIGGGCFIVMRLADGSVHAIDGREMAPALAHKDMFLRDGQYLSELSRQGALAIGVPGSVAALYHAQKSAGKLSLSDVVLPAADIAEKGFAIDAVLAKRLARTAKVIRQFPDTAKVFLDKSQKPLEEGSTLVQKDLATTYRKLAKQGPNYYYRGDFAKRVDAWMRENKGLIRKSDFANYQLQMRSPIQTEHKGFSLVSFPPPSSGGVLIAEMLNILDHFDLKKMSEADRYHLLIETMKLAFADRAHWLGDPDFTKVPKGLIDKNYGKALAAKIDMDKASSSVTHGIPPKAELELFGKHTTHISTVDKQGNWVAITTTLNTSFGSKVTIPGTGVLMNNQMDDFAAQPGKANAFGLVGSEANSIAPGKRPLSSMSPTIVLKEGKPVLTVGAAGGPTIITQVFQTIVNHLLLDMPLPEAMETVRVHQQWRPSSVFIDPYASPQLRKALEKKGHAVRDWPPFGATQAIGLNGNAFTAVTEPRLVSGNR